jgi:hypothetical protein
MQSIFAEGNADINLQHSHTLELTSQLGILENSPETDI